jgi:hypothetical protein
VRIELETGAHSYRINGLAVPSVTGVLADLYDWGGISAAKLERKRILGTAVHKAIELDVRDDLDESSVDPQIAGYFEAWRRFRKEARLSPVLAERPVGSKNFWYAGTLDLAGDLGGIDALIDIKTSARPHASNKLQTAAYLLAASEMRLMRKTAHRFVLILQPDATYRVEPHISANDFSVFLSCLSRHNWRIANGMLKETRQ